MSPKSQKTRNLPNIQQDGNVSGGIFTQWNPHHNEQEGTTNTQKHGWMSQTLCAEPKQQTQKATSYMIPFKETSRTGQRSLW